MEYPGKYKALPGRFCYLILLFLQGLFNKEEGDELDDWITASDENLEILEDLTDRERKEFMGKIYYRDDSGSCIHI